MSKLTPAHFPGIVRELAVGLEDGTISALQAREFCHDVETVVMEKQVELSSSRPRTPRQLERFVEQLVEETYPER